MITPSDRRPRRLTPVLLVLGLLLGFMSWSATSAPPAAAHSEIVDSTPKMAETVTENPKEIILVFDHELDTQFPAVALTIGEDIPVDLQTRVDGRRVIATVGEVPELIVDGPVVWKVGYRLLAKDGEPLGGTMAFFVDDGYAGPPPTTDAGVEDVPTDPATAAPAPVDPAAEQSTSPVPADPGGSAEPAGAATGSDSGSGPGALIWILVIVALLAAGGVVWWLRARAAAAEAAAKAAAARRSVGRRTPGKRR